MQVDDATKKLGYRLAWGAQWMGEPFCISFRDQDVKSLLFSGVLSLRICLRISQKNLLKLTSQSNPSLVMSNFYISAIVLEVGDVNFAEAQGAAWLHMEIAVRIVVEMGEKLEAQCKHHENHHETCFGTNSVIYERYASAAQKVAILIAIYAF